MSSPAKHESLIETGLLVIVGILGLLAVAQHFLH